MTMWRHISLILSGPIFSAQVAVHNHSGIHDIKLYLENMGLIYHICLFFKCLRKILQVMA